MHHPPPRPHRRRTARPSGRPCPTGKLRFRDHAEAVSALHAAARSRQTAAELGVVTARREVRTYPCTLCHGHHLTSQPGAAA